jgi:hypothetical protein
MAHDIISIAHDSQYDTIIEGRQNHNQHEHIHRDRLRVDSRIWLASKLRPISTVIYYRFAVIPDKPIQQMLTLKTITCSWSPPTSGRSSIDAILMLIRLDCQDTLSAPENAIRHGLCA